MTTAILTNLDFPGPCHPGKRSTPHQVNVLQACRATGTPHFYNRLAHPSPAQPSPVKSRSTQHSLAQATLITAPEQHQNRVRTAPEQRQIRARTAPEHHLNSEQHQNSARTAPKHHRNSTKTAPEQRQNSIRLAPEQATTNRNNLVACIVLCHPDSRSTQGQAHAISVK